MDTEIAPTPQDMDPQIMDGWLAEVKRRGLSTIIFRPRCDWHSKQMQDSIAEIELDFGDALKEFGEEVMNRVSLNEIVPLSRKNDDPDLTLWGCPMGPTEALRTSYPSSYGHEEDIRIVEHCPTDLMTELSKCLSPDMFAIAKKFLRC